MGSLARQISRQKARNVLPKNKIFAAKFDETVYRPRKDPIELKRMNDQKKAKRVSEYYASHFHMKKTAKERSARKIMRFIQKEKELHLKAKKRYEQNKVARQSRKKNRK